MKKALITGINGMDGSHIADFLLDKGYEVYGMERRSSSRNDLNTKHLRDKITFKYGDMTDQNSLTRLLKEIKPDEVYNLAAQSYVGLSWTIPEQTSNVTAIGPLRILEAIREVNKDIKFYQASSSEMFGKIVTPPGNEDTPFAPRSPYGVSKLYGHWITKNYRESHDIHASCGILFNHESERRSVEFVTRKISNAVARIHCGLSKDVCLGNLDAIRDWGYAPDYVEAMWLMLQQDTPGDYVIATGTAYSVKDFLATSFKIIGIDDYTPYVTQNPKYMRPADIGALQGDCSKAKQILGWESKTSFDKLVSIMVENDIDLIKRGIII